FFESRNPYRNAVPHIHHRQKCCGYSPPRLWIFPGADLPVIIGVCNGPDWSVQRTRIRRDFHALQSHRGGGFRAPCRLCHQRIGTKLPPGVRVWKCETKGHGCQLNAQRQESFVSARSTPCPPGKIAATTGSKRCRQNARWGEKGANVKGTSPAREPKQQIARTTSTDD